MSTDCVFCKIAAGELPCKVVFENDHVLAFLDINPLSEGHVLVIPKQHYAFIHECPGEILQHVAQALPKISSAVCQAVDCEGYNVLCNNGAAAGQEVSHIHFHIIPRVKDDGVFTQWPAKQYPQGRLDQLFEKIKNFI